MSEKIWYAIVGLALLLTGIVVGVIMQTSNQEIPEPVQQIDYSDRFDRIEAGITNSAIDICFQWGGQWITDQNNLVTQEFDIPLQDGSFAKGQAILCVKQTQEVQ